MRKRSKKLRILVFLGLFITFLVMGTAGIYFVSSRANLRNQGDQEAKLKGFAHLVAVQIEQLHSIDTNSTLSQADKKKLLRKTIEQVIGSFPEIQNITVFQQVNRKIRVLTAVTAPNLTYWNDGDLVDDQYPEVNQVFAGQTLANVTDVYQDRFGTWKSSVYPTLNSNAEIAGVIKVDFNAKDQFFQNALVSDLRVAFAFALAISIAAAWLLSQAIVRKIEPNITEKQAKSRKLLAEVVLILLVCGLIFDGGTALLARKARYNQQAIIISKIRVLTEIENAISSPVKSSQIVGTFNQLLRRAGELGLTQTLVGFPAELDDPVKTKLLFNSISKAEAALSKELLRLSAENSQDIFTQARITLIAGLICAVAAVLIRYASAKDDQIFSSQRRQLAVQKQYADVVENIPIGLFTYKDSEFSFHNHEWLSQMSRINDESHSKPWYSAILEEDQEKLINCLKVAEHEQSPFSIQFRVQGDSRVIRHLETSGVPVWNENGQFSHLLGFTLDLTARNKAKLALQDAYKEVEKKNKLLGTALSELEESLESMVRSFVKAVEAKDPYTAGHSERVMQYSVWLGQAIGLGPYELRILELGTLVHDVGKIGIPDAILTKPGRLTDEEYEIIKKHPEWGEQIINNIALFKECLPIVRSHHERLDGKGYPDGLKDGEISVLVRIAAIADIFDAMTSTRAYRKGMDVETVLQHMYEVAQRGEIDAHLFTVFCQIIKEKGIIPQNVEQGKLKAS